MLIHCNANNFLKLKMTVLNYNFLLPYNLIYYDLQESNISSV